MRRVLSVACAIASIAVLWCMVCAASASEGVAPIAGPTIGEAVNAKRVIIEFKDAPVVDAIKELIGDEPVSIAFCDIPEDLRVTATIRNASPEEAVMLLCAAAGLEWEDVGRDSGVIRMPLSVTVGGARVPVVGAMSVGSRGSPITLSAPALELRQGAMSVGSRGSPTELFTISAPVEAPWISAEPARPTFDGDDKLVDLDVKDAPIRDAMAKLSEASGIPIYVAEPVSNELKVTATIYRMPIGDVLSLIVGQANLAYTVDYVKDETDKAMYEQGLIDARELASRKGNPEIYIVPKPELRVSGPGAVNGEELIIGSFRRTPVPGSGAVGEGILRESLMVVPVAPATCAKCGGNVAPDWKFCPACGAPSPHTDQPAEKVK